VLRRTIVLLGMRITGRYVTSSFFYLINRKYLTTSFFIVSIEVTQILARV
jgi:hypothetical protein